MEKTENQQNQDIDFSKINRIEVISRVGGRILVEYGDFEASVQDNGKTLKIFKTNPLPEMRIMDHLNIIERTNNSKIDLDDLHKELRKFLIPTIKMFPSFHFSQTNNEASINN